MSELQIFLGEFGPTFIGVSIVFSMVSLGRVLSLNGTASFIGPKYFEMLNTFPMDVQRQLLHDAYRKAYPGWRSSIPVLIYSTLFSVSIAAGQTLTKIGIIPDSLWLSVVMSMLILGLGGWIIRRLEVNHIRPFLMLQIVQTAGDGNKYKSITP
jgi:hypothetical protein